MMLSTPQRVGGTRKDAMSKALPGGVGTSAIATAVSALAGLLAGAAISADAVGVVSRRRFVHNTFGH